jgi:hypothetical protein
MRLAALVCNVSVSPRAALVSKSNPGGRKQDPRQSLMNNPG